MFAVQQTERLKRNCEVAWSPIKVIELLMKSLVSLILILSALVLVACEKTPLYKEPSFEGKNYVIDVSGLSENMPDFYSVSIDNRRVSFFLVLVNGEVQAYFDACRKCYPHKKGYRLYDDFVVCKYCGERYAVYTLKKGIGSCYPIHINGTVLNGKYLISTEALSIGAKYF